MAKHHDKKKGGDEEPPAPSGPFDPISFAKDVLEEPAIEERPTRPVEVAPTTSKAPRRATPAGVLGLANASAPSAPPISLPPVTRRAENIEELAKMAQRSFLPEEPVTATGKAQTITAAPPSEPLPRFDMPLDPSTAPPPASARTQGAMVTRPPPAEDVPALEKLLREQGRRSTVDPSELDAQFPLRSEAPVPPATEQEMNDRVALGDYTGALEVAERILAEDTANKAAKSCAESCRAVLRQMYVARIGPLDRVPLVMVSRDQLRWLSIDHRAGFVLSLVDGVSSVEMILDVSGMPQLDTLRILCDLAQQRIISFR